MAERIFTVTENPVSELNDFRGQELSWSAGVPPIPVGAQRATVTVPVDYARPDDEVIDLAIVRHPAADPAQRLGVLLVAPDDPGARGIPLLSQLLPVLPAEIVERYDIVCFDHRFSGDSAPIDFALTMDEIFWVFHSSADFEAESCFQEGIARKAALHGNKALSHLTSLNIARDIDVIRCALNEDKISYLGYSYGSYLGTVYTQLFGAHTDRVVLDSVLSPEWVWRGLFRAIAASVEVGLTNWAGWAADRDAQLHLGDTAESVRHQLDTLLAAAGRGSVTVPGLPIPLDAAMFRLITLALLQSDQTHLLLGDLLRAVAHQDPLSPATNQALGAMFSQPREQSTAAAQLAILCGDHPWPRSVDTYRADTSRDLDRYPFLGAVLSGIKPGAFWPVTSRESVAVIGRNNPAQSILLVQAAGDVFAPSHGARRLRELLAHNSRLITVADSVQHRVFPFYRHHDVNETVCAYLINGELPKADRNCASQSAGRTGQKR